MCVLKDNEASFQVSLCICNWISQKQWYPPTTSNAQEICQEYLNYPEVSLWLQLGVQQFNFVNVISLSSLLWLTSLY